MTYIQDLTQALTTAYIDGATVSNANLRRIDDESGNTRVVARALLPFEINEGTKLKWEMLQYEIVE